MMHLRGLKQKYKNRGNLKKNLKKLLHFVKLYNIISSVDAADKTAATKCRGMRR